MNPNAMRGTILVAVLVLIGAMILGLTDRSGSATSVVEAVVEAPTPEVLATEVAVVPTATPPPSLARPPAQVKVQVANASGVGGVATNMTSKLVAAGYSTGEPTNAVPSQVSILYYEPTYEADATAILTNVFSSPDTRIAPMPEPPPEVDYLDPTTNVLIIVAGDQLATS